MITLDILKIAQDKNAEEQFVQLMANAQNLIHQIPAHRWISKLDYVAPQVNQSQVDYRYKFFPDRDTSNAPGRNTDRFFMGECTLSFRMNNVLSFGAFSMSVYVNVSPDGNAKGDAAPFLVYYSDQVVNTFVVNQLITVQIPFVPVYNLEVSWDTDASAQIQFQMNCLWNGVYFKQG